MVRRIVHSYRNSYSGLPPELWVVALSLWINRCGAMVLAYLSIYLHESVGMTEAHAGRMISVFGVGAILGTLIGARLVELVGAMRIQTLAILLATPLYWLLPLWRSPIAIALNVLLLSLMTEMVRPANSTLVAKIAAPADRARAFALQRLAANLGFAFGGLLGGVLASFDYRLLFLVNGSTTLAAALILLAYFRLRKLPGEASRSMPLAAGPISDARFMVFLGLFLLSSLVFFQFISNYTLYLKKMYELTEANIGVLFAVNTLIVVVFEMPLVEWVKRWPTLRVVAWGCALTCIGFGILPFGATFTFAIFSMVIMSIGEMLSMPLAATYAANRSPAGAESRYMGWWSMCIAVAFVLGPMIGSWLYGIDSNLLWYVSLAVAAVVFVGYYLMPGGEDHSRQQPEILPAPDARDLIAEGVGS